MARYGFIHSKEDIKFLVLFAMDLLPFAVDYTAIVDLTTWCDDGFGYLELSDAFFEMIPTGHIAEEKQGEQTLYRITEKGRETMRVFEQQLPYAVREEAQRSALRVVRQLRRNASLHVSVEARAENDMTVRMEMDEVFAIEMNVVNRNQANILDHTFRENAEKIYQTLLAALTENYQAKEEQS